MNLKPNFSMAEITRKYIGKPFVECSCLKFPYLFYLDCGVDSIQTEFGEWNIDNYMELFRVNKRLAFAEMVKAFKQIGSPTPINDLKIADLLVVYQPSNKGMFPAVYCGGYQAMASFLKTGVSMFQLDKGNKPVMARRII